MLTNLSVPVKYYLPAQQTCLPYYQKYEILYINYLALIFMFSVCTFCLLLDAVIL